MKRAFGELELAILYLLESGERKTVKDVHRLLGGNDKYTTIMTVMNRLVDKQRLGRERHGLQYEYWITSTESQMPSLVQQLKDKIFGLKTAKLVSHLIDTSTDITEEELASIENLVKAAKQKRKLSENEK
jgi:predicted transcriptional regulator